MAHTRAVSDDRLRCPKCGDFLRTDGTLVWCQREGCDYLTLLVVAWGWIEAVQA